MRLEETSHFRQQSMEEKNDNLFPSSGNIIMCDFFARHTRDKFMVLWNRRGFSNDDCKLLSFTSFFTHGLDSFYVYEGCGTPLSI